MVLGLETHFDTSSFELLRTDRTGTVHFNARVLSGTGRPGLICEVWGSERTDRAVPRSRAAFWSQALRGPAVAGGPPSSHGTEAGLHGRRAADAVRCAKR